MRSPCGVHTYLHICCAAMAALNGIGLAVSPISEKEVPCNAAGECMEESTLLQHKDLGGTQSTLKQGKEMASPSARQSPSTAAEASAYASAVGGLGAEPDGPVIQVNGYADFQIRNDRPDSILVEELTGSGGCRRNNTNPTIISPRNSAIWSNGVRMQTARPICNYKISKLNANNDISGVLGSIQPYWSRWVNFQWYCYQYGSDFGENSYGKTTEGPNGTLPEHCRLKLL